MWRIVGSILQFVTQLYIMPPHRYASQKGGRGKEKKEPKKPVTQEELDRQMDDYMMKDPKTAEKKLEDDMDAYWAAKKSKGGDDAADDNDEAASEDDGKTAGKKE